MAPDFDLPRDGGGSLRLSGLRGKSVVKFLYPNANNNGFKQEANQFSGLKVEFAAAGAVLVGMSPDSAKKHDKFMAKHGLTVNLVSDENKETLEAYGVWTEKSMYGRKYMGVERSTFLIDPEGKIAKVWRKVKVPGHARSVLDALSEG